jgi:hypothetical protein
MKDERRKLEYLLGRIFQDGAEIIDALEGEYFDEAEEVLHSYVENVGEDYDASDGQEDVVVELLRGEDLLKLRWKFFLMHWEITDDHSRN